MKKVKYKMGKLGKYRFMNRFHSIKAYLPDTRAATKSNLKTMIGRYESLYLKPDEGTGGHGIYKITKTKKGYTLRNGVSARNFSSIDTLYGAIHTVMRKNKYLVQRGIDLLKHNNRAFDIRVMVQKNRKRVLVPTGIVGRLGRPKKIVTNFHSGGTPLPIGTLLSSHLKGNAKTKYIRRMEELGREASRVLGKSYRSKRAFGVDIAIDAKMKPWILEINTQPDRTIFNALKDKTMYKRIQGYAKIK
ncbi:YheC/YheD family protein [Paenibacillus humicola]|uniref:YheC/YheD family protein n=1 Tax=Paenibacillus humicola TaxID=3110540 RepID=UPI00237B8591|nr:YheC/YheD family protein [Paenibacillus humicola]